jgi:hypothetical protein
MLSYDELEYGGIVQKMTDLEKKFWVRKAEKGQPARPKLVVGKKTR